MTTRVWAFAWEQDPKILQPHLQKVLPAQYNWKKISAEFYQVTVLAEKIQRTCPLDGFVTMKENPQVVPAGKLCASAMTSDIFGERQLPIRLVQGAPAFDGIIGTVLCKIAPEMPCSDIMFKKKKNLF